MKSICYRDVDIFTFCEKIIDNITTSYKTDFDYDKASFIVAAKKADTLPLRKRTFLWMARRCGTWSFLEEKVFIMTSPQHNTWLFYNDNNLGDDVCTFVIEVNDYEGGRVHGNIYPIDYREECKKVEKLSVPGMDQLVYGSGTICQDFGKPIYTVRPNLGRLMYSEPVARDDTELANVLDILRTERRSSAMAKKSA